MKILKYRFTLNQLNSNQINYKKIDNKKINFIHVELNNKSIAKYIFESFNMALNLIKKNSNISLINGPINKKKILNQKFLGITEYLDFKSKSKGKAVMLIFNKTLSVSPLTTHVPLKKVHSYINKIKIISHVKTIDKFYKKRFKIKPIIGITGLNPHCESNFRNSEEEKIISPAIKFLKSKKYKVTGPYSGDTIFLKNNYKKFDVIIGMYHDQVLAPIKTLYEYDAINLTIGLPFIRVSPDHGPNENMIGKNKSNYLSLHNSIKFLDF